MTTTRPRSRGTKTPLSFDAIIDAALECLRSGGPSGLTMRKVAAGLQTGAGSLYVYVPDLAGLQVAVLDRIAASVPKEAGDNYSRVPWQDRAVSFLLAYAGTLMTFPGAARLAMATTPTGPHSLDLLEQLFTILLDSGAPPERCSWALDTLILLVTATAAEQDARTAENAESIPDAYAGAIAADPERRPNLAQASADLFTTAGEVRLEWSIRAILDALVPSRS